MNAKRRVLVVDAADTNRGMLRQVLAAAGFQVDGASTTAEALQRARERPDVIVLDAQLPHGDSLELCRRFKAEPATAAILVVQLSAAPRRREPAAAKLKSGADAYVTTPAEPRELVATINTLLRARRVEAEARRVSEIFRLLVDTAPTLIVALDGEARVALFNPACERLTGYAREEIIGRPITLLIPEPWRDAVHVSFAGETLAATHLHPWLTASGEERMIEWRCFRLSASGLTVGMGTDVTERQRTEARLATQLSVTHVLAHAATVDTAMRELLRALCEGLAWSLGEMWRVDPQSRRLQLVTTWYGESTSLEDFVEASRRIEFPRGGGLPGVAWERGQPVWSDLAREPTFVRATAAAKVGLRVGLAFPVATGGNAKVIIALYRAHVSPPDPTLVAMLADVGGQIAQFLERKDAEDQAEAVRRRLRFLADASAALALSIDYQTTLRTVADLAVPDLADWCVVDIVAEDGSLRRLAMAHADAGKLELAREIERRYPTGALEGRGPLNVIRTGEAELCIRVTEAKLTMVTQDAAHASLLRELGFTSYMSVPLQIADRTLGAMTFGIAASGREFTPGDLALAKDLARRAALAIDNARLYRAAQDANRVKDDFLATLSHELRSPMTSVLSWARILRTRTLDDAGRARGLETIERNAALQVQLIDDLLDVSRIMSRTLELTPRLLALPPIIDAVANAVGPAAEAKRIALDVTLDETAGPISGDPVRLQQIVWNLVSNAIKFTPAAGRVEIRLERTSSAARIVVRDTGRGIGADFLPYVFEPFRQADRSMTRRQHGLGLGLAIVRRLVDLHGGAIRVESEGLGRGTTCTVELPLAGGRASTAMVVAEPQRAADRPPTLDGIRVLLVDDDMDTRDVLGLALTQFGAVVTTAEAAEAALKALGDTEPDVVVIDIAMPDEDGYVLVGRIRSLLAARGRMVPAIAVTAYATPEDRDRARRAGYDVHLAKPVDGTRLAEVIAQLLRHDRSCPLEAAG